MKSGRTILVVAPAADRRARFVALLARAGHDVVEVASTQEALAFVALAPPPLVVFDTERATFEALLDVCRKLKADWPDTFILQISKDHTSDSETPTELDPSIDAYLVDPIDPQEMVVLVRSLLRLQKVEADLRDSEDRLLLAQESAGLAILDWIIPSNTFVHSENFLELFDLVPSDLEEAFTSSQLLERLHPDDLPDLVEDFAAVSQTARSFEKEFRIVCRDGSVRWISSRGRFFLDASGNPERMVSLSFDVTQRKTAERTNAELASIVASSIDAIVSIDLAGRVTSWNAGAERLFDLPSHEIIGRTLRGVFDSMSAEERAGHFQRLIAGDAHEFELRKERPGAEPLDLSVTSAPMRDGEGEIIGASLIIRDVSVQKHREEHVRFLMRELTHRSKNLLAVIQAMARQSVTRGMTPEEFVRRFTDRLAGLAGSHDLLSSVDWKGASLMDLIRSQLSHYEDLFGSRILLEGEDITIRPSAAQNIGIALHELSTNAAKYGALSNESGTVTISWSDASDTLHLTWREMGGPLVKAPTRQGFGQTVMDKITGRALGGKSAVEFAPDGVVWRLEAAMASVSAR